jgi:hypothetical protein
VDETVEVGVPYPDIVDKPKGLRRKLCEIMGKVGYIEKRGQNEAQHYAYVMAADINASMGKLLAEHGICVWPKKENITWTDFQTSKGTAMFLCRAQITYVFCDAETKEEIEVPSTGEGMDTGDKSGFKARTGALKYALIQTFLIAAGEDPESEHEEHAVDASTNAPKIAEQKVGLPPCPSCGAFAMIVGKPEYGGGFVCYKKKGGCGATYPDTDPRFTSRGVPDGVAADNGQHPQGILARITISAEQVALLESWCNEFNVEPSALIRQYSASDKAVKRLADLTPVHFKHAEVVFKAKLAKRISS